MVLSQNLDFSRISFRSIDNSNMKDKHILFFGGIIALLSLSYWATVFVHVVTFPRGGQGEKVVVSGCGLCSPGVRLALWVAGSTRPAAHSLHSHITWLGWRWQYGDNNDLILAIATVGGYLAFSSVVVYNTTLWMSAWRPYVRLKPNEEVGYIREGSTK